MLGDIKIRIATDMMSAFACIIYGENEISVDYIKEKLREAGVSGGIIKEGLEELVESGADSKWILVAKGREPGETIPGYFEYFFEKTDENAKTAIDENGKVHYGKTRTMVVKGEKLAKYHKSVSGSFGYTVCSSVIAPKPVKECYMRAGEGVQKDGDEYYASLDGEIILKDEYIGINNILVIDGNARYGIDSETEFVGDIHIKGDVLKGVSIKVNGSIEVDGNVEACNLEAGKDVIIHGGIQGDSTAVIKAMGSVTCPFIENATVIAEQNIQADYVMKSNLSAGNKILIHGHRGVIIGGVAVARNEITAGEVGNSMGVCTKLEIDNPNKKFIDYSKVVIEYRVHDNVQTTIGGLTFCRKLEAKREYHLVNGQLLGYKIGRYVPLNKYVEEERKKTVLIVDDEPIILKTFFGFLSGEYEVLLAASAKDAKAILEQRDQAPDMILLDYNMPVMDGAEFLQSIREDSEKAYSHVPVMFVTASTDKETITKCLNLYPQGYLIKPLGKDELLQTVRKYFESGK